MKEEQADSSTLCTENVVFSSEIAEYIATITSEPVEEAYCYFDSRLDTLHRNRRYERLMEVIVELGKRASKKNATFISALKTPGDYVAVEHGEVCISKLTDSFSSWSLLHSKYIFMLTNGITYVIKSPKTTLSHILQGDTIGFSSLTMSGPEGGGKSFLLQYIVRKLRSMPTCRVLYISNPESFTNRTKHNRYYLIVAEILFAFADDFSTDLGRGFQEKLVDLYNVLASSSIEESPAILASALESLQEFCHESGLQCISVLDHEDSFANIESTDAHYVHHQQVCSLLQSRKYFHHVITCTSLVSNIESAIQKTDYFEFVQKLYDHEIGSIVNIAYSIREPPCPKFETVEAAVRMLIGNCGRWISEISAVINFCFEYEAGMVLGSNEYYDGSIQEAGLEENPDELYWLRKNPIVASHLKWFESISGNSEDFEKFLALLSIADCGPPISATGMILFRTTKLLEQDQNSNPSNSIKPKPEHAIHKKWINLADFKGCGILAILSNPSSALTHLDRRFFYIDDDLYVRATCPLALALIRVWHQGRVAYETYRRLYEASAGTDSALHGRFFESTIMSWLRLGHRPYVITLPVTNKLMSTTSSLSCKISRRMYMSQWSAVTLVSQPDRFNGTLFIALERNSLMIDFCIISNSNKRESSLSEECNFVPILVEGSQYEEKYKSLSEDCTTCDLILVKVIGRLDDCAHLDTMIIDAFQAEYQNSTKRTKTHIDDTSSTKNNSNDSKSTGLSREVAIMSSMMAAFMDSCLEVGLRPKIYFVWWTCQKSEITSIHERSLICREDEKL